MANKIQIRRDVAANWTSSNPTLSQGEQGYETDTGKIKIGDGSTAWTSLAYNTSYSDADVDTHLNTSTATTGEVLSWSGTDYDWIAAGGGGADLYAANESSPSAQPSATGANAIAIGDRATASGDKSIALGWGQSQGLYSMSGPIGNYLSTYGAIADYSLAIGSEAKASGSYGVALGRSVVASGSSSLSLGFGGTASATNAVAIGDSNTASHANAIVIGDSVQSTTTNEVSIGGTADTVRISESYTLPTSDGTNGQVLTTDGSGAVTFADAGGGADLYAANESSPSAQPSATGANAIAIGDSATSSGDDSVAIGNLADATALRAFAVGVNSTASGSNSIVMGANATASGSASVAIGAETSSTQSNSLAVGYQAQAGAEKSFAAGDAPIIGSSGTSAVALGTSYANGTDSFAAAIALNSSTYGALSGNSVAIGKYAKSNNSNGVAIGNGSLASGLSAVTLGISSLASGTFSTAIGYGSYASAGNSVSVGRSSNASGSQSLALGYQSSASGTYSTAIGRNAKAELYGKLAYAAHDFGAGSFYSQTGTYVLLSDTTDATAEALTTNNTTAATDNQVILPNNSAYSFSGTIIARESAAAGSDYASWEIKGALLRDANAASTVLGNGIKNKLYASAGASAWDIALTADTTNGGLKIEVTGAAATNIRWVATVNTSEVTYS